MGFIWAFCTEKAMYDMFSAEIWTVTSSFHPFFSLFNPKNMSPFGLPWNKVLEDRGEFEVTLQVAKVQNRPRIKEVGFFNRVSMLAKRDQMRNRE